MFRSNVLSALQSLWEQRQRTALSALGVLVANVAILLLVSIAIGVRQDISGQVEDLGVNTIIVLPGKVEPGAFNPNIGGQSYLKEELVAELLKVPGVVRAAPLTFAGGGVRYGSKEATPFVIATTSDWFRIRPLKMRFGKAYDDPRSKERIVVMGSIAANSLFGAGTNPIGKVVSINSHDYRVVGVTQDAASEQSLFSFGSFQNVVYVPFHTQKALDPRQQVDRIMVQGAQDAEPKRLVASMKAVLARQLDDQQFSVLTQEDLLKLVYKLTGILTWLLTGLTSIALFVGGVGIMTVMLMSVSERAKEIGIRKTVGARRNDIFLQFLIEAVFIAMLGGAVGLAISYGACLALFHLTPVKPLVTSGVVALCLGVSLGIGSAFGLIPAMKAARRDPVESLRHE